MRTIDRRRFLAARDLFIQALALPPEAREAFVRRACGDDQAVLVETLSLLARHADDPDPVDHVTPWPGMEPLPATIGPWRVLGLLGQGGMGVVYRARRDDDEAAAEPRPEVALKVLRAQSLSGNLERRFMREIEVLRRLDHPGIARLLEAGSTDGTPWLATELIDGVNLSRWRADADPPLPARVRLLAELCDAVQAAHALGVVHRDLKPENILVTPEGHPKILDFGIARLQDESTQLSVLVTQTWQLLGTIRYMSPEQATGGTAAIDARTDIYTLGVIAYELLTGSLPYDLRRLSTPRALLEIATVEPQPLGGRDPGLALIVGHALEKDPACRYPTAAAMAGDLRCHLEGRPISVRPAGAVTRLRRGLRARPRLRRAAVAALVLALAVTAALALATRQREPAPTWDEVFARIESADVMRQSGPRTPEGVRTTILLFEQLRTDLSRLPGAPYAGDVERYIKLRLGEMHYVLGELLHDADVMLTALEHWRHATQVAWRQGSALEIDPRHAARVDILRYGRHTPWVGQGIGYAGLSWLRAPATNLALAAESERFALDMMGDGTQNFHDGSTPSPDFPNRRAAVYFNYGAMLSAYGAVVDSVEPIDRGLAWLREISFAGRERQSGQRSSMAEAHGLAHLRRARFQSGATAAASLDSAQAHLERAAGLMGVAYGRAYWQVHRGLSAVWEARSGLTPTPAARRQCLLEAGLLLERSLTSLQPGLDELELALTHADRAALQAELAALDGDRARFARADSLLALGAALEQAVHYPLQHAERELRKAQVLRLQWVVSGDRADSLAAAAACGEARQSVPAAEWPSLHRRVREQDALLAAGR